MRRLVACAACRRQYDASKLEPGARFRCRCGTVVAVPSVQVRDAAVVRCSACGAPREQESAACGFCRADFTLHERDLQTICPSCLARISDRARFCHHCGTRIVLEGRAGEAGPLPCPGCADGRKLHGRLLGAGSVAASECSRCAGLWLGRQTFEAVVDRMRDSAEAWLEPTATPSTGKARGSYAVVYRRCPECSERMSRTNFARRSGVIVDVCRKHGLWFDAHELDSILRWIREGGELRAAEREREEQKVAAMRERFRVEPKVPEGETSLGKPAQGLDLVGLMLRLFD